MEDFLIFPKTTSIQVPNLLLSYTYYLNNSHTTSISVGLDTEDFKLKIILYKNGLHHALNYEDWFLLYKNNNHIEAHFNGEKTIAKNIDGSCGIRYKLSTRASSKCLTLHQYQQNINKSKKIHINADEWKILNSLSSFLNSIITWFIYSSNDAQLYYEQYVAKCIELNTLKLDSQYFFMPPALTSSTPTAHPVYYCNYSRLFHEIPILCNPKLINDLYVILCKN